MPGFDPTLLQNHIEFCVLVPKPDPPATKERKRPKRGPAETAARGLTRLGKTEIVRKFAPADPPRDMADEGWYCPQCRHRNVGMASAAAGTTECGHCHARIPIDHL